jgi:hypothetical protein
MFDLPDTTRAAEPRCSVRFEGDGTWSAFRGIVLLASGLPTVADAWDVIDRAAPIRLPAARLISRRSYHVTSSVASCNMIDALRPALVARR